MTTRSPSTPTVQSAGTRPRSSTSTREGRSSTGTLPRTGSSRKVEHLLETYSGKTLGTFRLILSLFWPLRALQLRLVKIVKKGQTYLISGEICSGGKVKCTRASVTCTDLLAVVLSTFTNYFVFRNCEKVANCESWIFFSLRI